MKNNQRIIAIFKEEQVILDYTKMLNKVGIDDDGKIFCDEKYRIYGGKGTSYPMYIETIELHKGGILPGYVYMSYYDKDDELHEIESDMLLVIGDEKTEAIFFYPYGDSNDSVYNKETGEKF